MLWIRGVVFSVLVPGVIGGYLPWLIGPRRLASGWWKTGWILVAAGVAVYAICLLSFLRARGTPAIFFTRHLRHLLGEEPKALVRTSIYRYSRNPMYLAVVGTIFGQALLFASAGIAAYGVVIFAAFCGVVIGIEEPHLRARDPQGYPEYCRKTPRWLGLTSETPHARDPASKART